MKRIFKGRIGLIAPLLGTFAVVLVGTLIPAVAAASEGTQSTAQLLGISADALQLDGRVVLGAFAVVIIAAMATMVALVNEAVNLTRNPLITHRRRR